MGEIKASLAFFLSAIVCFSNAASTGCPGPCTCHKPLDTLQVDCSRNGLTKFPNLGNLPVEYVDLSHNAFTRFPRQYSYIKSLRYLDLSNNKISNLEANVLHEFDALQILKLANNSFEGWKSINSNETFRKSHLKSLSLSFNSFEDLSDANINNLLVSSSLKELELENCNIIHAIGDKLLNGLPNLEHIKLSGNKISSIKPWTSLTLRVLELSNCSIENVDQPKPNTTVSHIINLEGLPELDTINLSSNYLKSIDSKTFQNNTKLKIIDLSNNFIHKVEVDAFTHLSLLTTLDLSNNRISTLDAKTIIANRKLISLDLSFNIIEDFVKLESNSLQTLNVSNNRITRIHFMDLEDEKKLQTLDLSKNSLDHFPKEMLANELQNLNLSKCGLTGLHDTAFRGFPELRQLHLNGNRFSSVFPVILFKNNMHLKSIWMGDNPWNCICEKSEFKDLFEYLTKDFSRLKDLGDVRCFTPNNHERKNWLETCWNSLFVSTYSIKDILLNIILLLIIIVIAIFRKRN